MLRRNLSLIAALALGLTAAAGAAAKKKTADRDFYWYFYPIDTTGIIADPDFHYGTAVLRYDAKGTPKVAYGRSLQDLYYAELNGNEWKWQKVDTSFKDEAKLDMALDADGNPHIAYEDYLFDKIHYAGYDGTDWKKAIVDSTMVDNDSRSNFYSLGIAVDSKKNKHFLYPRKNTDADFHHGATYALLDADLVRQEREAICNCGSSPKWGHMVLTADEKPVAAFYSAGDGNDKVLVEYPKNADWMKDTVKSATGGPGYNTSLAIGKSDSLYISHQARDAKWLLMSSGKEGGPYVTEKVDSLPGTPLWVGKSPIAVNDSGVPFIAYIQCHLAGSSAYNVSDSKLRLAWKKNGTWSMETVDSSSAITGLRPDIAITKDGLPAIVYFNYSKHQLWLAVAKADAPADDNHNGIPDYQETPIGTVGLSKNLLKRIKPAGKRGAAWFDARGRKVDGVAAGKRLPKIAFPD